MRQSGIILHPTSLPSSGGIGTLGDAAYAFVDFLAEAQQQLWQVLPLGPTDEGHSPYMCTSAFAGNPLLIDLDRLRNDGWLAAEEIYDRPPSGPKVDFPAVLTFKTRCFAAAHRGFRDNASAHHRGEFEAFCREEADWLDDFSLFTALREAHQGAPWWTWELSLRRREADALQQARSEHAELIDRICFEQWVFFRQWHALHRYANTRGISIIGDMPIFVASNSADVWANQPIFQLDENGHRTVVAGVPPDYFSPTGQLWGNPLYRWDVLAERNYDWWVNRFRALLRMVDKCRIDHFRGFESFWEVPSDSPTAMTGRWVPGPGRALFDAVREQLGELPLIAEDLGIITEAVEQLRVALGLPGMKVLQFAFDGDPTNLHLPHNHHANAVVYPGTHDNNTIVGWYQELGAEAGDQLRLYFAIDGRDIAWQMLTAAWSSVADTAIASMQDLLSLGGEARMNTPGLSQGNWAWRLLYWQVNSTLALRLRELTRRFARAADQVIRPRPDA
ncbi:MAG: 4-alpha-glucanotransferase [Myxococcota bacterium]|jgi:4-alpha-glucanotransferase|nr:4-alpha-glucanotransferase [Myxococcota bacterium]